MTGLPKTEGEAWARDELEALRSARFRPDAIRAFLAASQRRAADTRSERPDLAAQARHWTGAGAGAWLALAAGGREPFRRRLVGGMAWWGAVALMLDWHLGMVETEDGRPRSLGPADALTLARAWLVPVIADDLAPAAVIAAGATDVLDGALARATKPTRAGRDLEGVVDGAVYCAALGAALRTGRLARPVAALEIGRLGAGLAFALGEYFGHARAPNRELTAAARATTPLRIAGLATAGSGRRRAGNALVAIGSGAALGALAQRLYESKWPAQGRRS